MKKHAVIVVGPHFSGKSKTIKKYFKALIGLRPNQRTFTLGGGVGAVLSQSVEEKRLGTIISQSIEEKRLANLTGFLSRYLACRWLVLAARPEGEPGSYYRAIVSLLKKHGFSVATVQIREKEPESFYRQQGNLILSHLT